ncbi:reverse transcriptase [Phytophthora megakarya]|uniref:Reverse transcriptase n=1 Tax=Phytophthora megakarya TaxID=4795 RepID=A0A225VLU2_9STRA|nr:reverse transcriptase [Phytophthora megakarya]
MQFSMSTADYPQTDGQTERVNHGLVDLLKSYAQSFHNWSDYLPMAGLAINNAAHASTGHTPFFVNAMRHPRLPSTLGAVASSLSGGGSTAALKQPQNTADTDRHRRGQGQWLDPVFSSQAMVFAQERQAVILFVQDAIAASADRQNLNADNVDTGKTN